MPSTDFSIFRPVDSSNKRLVLIKHHNCETCSGVAYEYYSNIGEIKRELMCGTIVPDYIVLQCELLRE